MSDGQMGTMNALLRRVLRLPRRLAWSGLAGLVLVGSAAAAEEGRSAKIRPNAVTVFAGTMTDNDWQEVFAPWMIDFRDARLAGIAFSRRLAGFEEKLSFEIEGQAVRHFAGQDHWEFNLPAIARWEAFPWDDAIDTSFAFGIGPSYASGIPKEEVAREGDSQRWLVYWLAELELARPDTGWSVVFRIHHRSEAFGSVAKSGGSNFLAIGLKRRF